MAKKAFLLGAKTQGLKYSDNDINLMTQCLSSNQYEIIKADPDKSSILSKLDDFADAALKTDTLIFYFSGHGYIQKGKLYLVLADDLSKNKNSIRITQILETLEQCAARNLLIILDCCRSATSARSWNPDEKVRYRMLTASGEFDEGKEFDELKASFLTYHFNKGLLEYAHLIADTENKIRINKFHDWLEKQVKIHNSRTGAIQVPIPSLFGNHKENIEIATIEHLSNFDRNKDLTFEDRRVAKEPSEQFDLTIFHSATKKIIQEQIKAVGHDKYISKLYIDRNIYDSFSSFINFEKIFKNDVLTIFKKLIKICSNYHLEGQILSRLLKAKSDLASGTIDPDFKNILHDIKASFYFNPIEDIFRSINFAIRCEPNIDFLSRTNTIKRNINEIPVCDKNLLRNLSEEFSDLRKHWKVTGEIPPSDNYKFYIIRRIFPSLHRYIGRKKLEEVDLANDFIKNLQNLYDSYLKRCSIIVSKAGYGKTNIVCHLAEQLSFKYPTLLFSGQMEVSAEYNIEHNIQQRLQTELPILSSNWLSKISEILESSKTWLFLIIDGINENSNISFFIRLLKNVLSRVENRRVKIILSCRDLFWDLFAPTIQPYLFENKPLFIDEFTDNELKVASENYFRYFNISCSLDGDATISLKNPLLLRFFCEAYRDQELGIITSLHLLSIFDLYMKRFSGEIAERFDMLRADYIINFLLQIGEGMWNNRSTEVTLASLNITPEEADKTNSIYNLIRTENIIIEQSSHIYSRKKIVRFVYDEFMEYIIARAWAEKLLASNDLQSDTEDLLQDVIHSISDFSPSFGGILFLDSMLKSDGKIVNIAISIIYTLGFEFIASRQITMLYAFEKMNAEVADEDVLNALDEFEQVVRDEYKERLAKIVFDALKKRGGHPILRRTVKRILEIQSKKDTELLKKCNENMELIENNYEQTDISLDRDTNSIPCLPPARYHYKEETKLNAISLLVASKTIEDYEYIDKGIRNLGKLDLHSALAALTSLDLADDSLVFKAISKYFDSDNAPLPEYRIFSAWLLRDRYGKIPARYLANLLKDDETRVHRYAFSLFKERLIENDLINLALDIVKFNNNIKPWHLINFIKILGNRSKFQDKDCMHLHGTRITETMLELQENSIPAIRYELCKTLFNYSDFFNIKKFLRMVQKDPNSYISNLADNYKIDDNK